MIIRFNTLKSAPLNWEEINPILDDKEIGAEISDKDGDGRPETIQLKIGNGKSRFSELQFSSIATDTTNDGNLGIHILDKNAHGLDILRKNITDADLPQIKNDISELINDNVINKTDIDELKSDVLINISSIENNTSNIENNTTEINGLKTNINTLTTDLETNKTDISGLKTSVLNLNTTTTDHENRIEDLENVSLTENLPKLDTANTWIDDNIFDPDKFKLKAGIYNVAPFIDSNNLDTVLKGASTLTINGINQLKLTAGEGAGGISCDNKRLRNVGEPVNAQDAVTKNYFDINNGVTKMESWQLLPNNITKDFQTCNDSSSGGAMILSIVNDGNIAISYLVQSTVGYQLWTTLQGTLPTGITIQQLGWNRFRVTGNDTLWGTYVGIHRFTY